MVADPFFDVKLPKVRIHPLIAYTKAEPSRRTKEQEYTKRNEKLHQEWLREKWDYHSYRDWQDMQWNVSDMERKYYSHIYTYTFPDGRKVTIPALLPYYEIRYQLKESEKRPEKHVLFLEYYDHSLDNFEINALYKN